MSSCGMFTEYEQELIEEVEVVLPTDEGAQKQEIRVPVKDVWEGVIPRSFVADFELENPSKTSVDVSVRVGLEGEDPDAQSGDRTREFTLESGDKNRSQPPVSDVDSPPADTFYVKIESTGRLKGHVRLYIREYYPDTAPE